jgi:ribokinase
MMVKKKLRNSKGFKIEFTLKIFSGGKMSKIVIFGSINVDLVSFTKEFPKLGETVNGTGFEIHQGGKGANQSVAVAKLGSGVEMIGAVGTDFFGDFLIKSLKNAGVGTEMIKKIDGTSGVANIWVNEFGENSIILDGGANGKIDESILENSKNMIKNAMFLMLQFEIPFGVVEKAAKIAHDNGVKVILDPAPARKIPDSFLSCVDYITPNEIEISQIADGKTLEEKIKNLELRGPRVIVKSGVKGVYIVENDKLLNLKSFKVESIDTTGAGDCFNGALAVSLSENMDMKNACTFAMAASAISVTRKGAGDSFPIRDEVQNFLRKNYAS